MEPDISVPLPVGGVQADPDRLVAVPDGLCQPVIACLIIDHIGTLCEGTFPMSTRVP